MQKKIKNASRAGVAREAMKVRWGGGYSADVGVGAGVVKSYLYATLA